MGRKRQSCLSSDPDRASCHHMATQQGLTVDVENCKENMGDEKHQHVEREKLMVTKMYGWTIW